MRRDGCGARGWSLVGASSGPTAAGAASGRGDARIGVANMNKRTRPVTAGGSRGNIVEVYWYVVV